MFVRFMVKKFVPLRVICLIRGLFHTNLCGLCVFARDKNVLLSGRLAMEHG